MVLLPPVHFTQVQFPEELNMQHEILKLYHNHLLAGHPGITNTTHLLAQMCEGKGMKEFTEEYICRCVTYQENKLCITHQKAPLQLITLDPHSRPFQMVAMDLIMDLPKSNGCNAVLTIINHRCSKAAKFIPYC